MYMDFYSYVGLLINHSLVNVFTYNFLYFLVSCFFKKSWYFFDFYLAFDTNINT